jgi:hypothetical protein
MRTNVVSLMQHKKPQEDETDVSEAMMREYFAIFDLKCDDDRKEAYAVWHAKAMCYKAEIKK